MSRKRTVAGLVALVLLTLTLVMITWVLPGRAADAAAKQAAVRYVGLVADAEETDLEELWGMTIATSPGAMRTAGELLIGATERIEVLAVGEPEVVDDQAILPRGADLESAISIPVRIRLDGHDWNWTLTLVKRGDRSGREVSDWRVLASGLPALDWGPHGGLDADPDRYVSGIRQERRTGFGTAEDEIQPLYPALYRLQRRMDPWYSSAEQDVAVVNNPATKAPEFTYQPTERTKNRIKREIAERLQGCASAVDYLRCPAEDLARAVGVYRPWSSDWWRGVTKRPHLEFDGDTVTLSDAVARARGPNGIRLVKFAGTGRYLYDNQSWKPTLSELTLVHTP